MSIGRLNTLMMAGILPFNFGMDYDAWVKLYAKESMRTLVGSDPATWSPEDIYAVNKQAKEELELYDRLMTLSTEDFRLEVARLEKQLAQDLKAKEPSHVRNRSDGASPPHD